MEQIVPVFFALVVGRLATHQHAAPSDEAFLMAPHA
jgi:hypothetical protein